MDELERARADEFVGWVVEDLTDAIVGEGDHRHYVLVYATSLGHDRRAIGKRGEKLDRGVGDDHADQDTMTMADVDDIAGTVDPIDEHDRNHGGADELGPFPVRE